MNTRYSFSTFVARAGSRTAVSVSQAVAENPGSLHNPLLLYGKTGSGKTHLLHAIAQVMTRESQRNIHLFTSETFVTRLIEAIKADQSPLFRRFLCGADALLLDDLELVATDRRRTRNEVVRLLAETAASGVQVVVTSRVPQGFVSRIEKPLRMRFPNARVVAVE